MNKTDSNQQPTKMFERIYNALGPSGLPTDDRGRMRMVVNNLVLHLHPTKVPVRTLRLSYTWGLGGLSGMLIMFLAFTGIFLQMNYTPSPSQAYLDILALRNNVWFGDLLRSIHHWSANLLVVITFLHLLRVFFTGGLRAPRETNWLVSMTAIVQQYLIQSASLMMTCNRLSGRKPCIRSINLRRQRLRNVLIYIKQQKVLLQVAGLLNRSKLHNRINGLNCH